MKEKPIVFQSKKELNKRINDHIKTRIDDTVKSTASSIFYMIIMILVDEFRFNKKQINTFMAAYKSKIECLDGGWVTIDDFETWCTEHGIELEIK